MATKNYLLLGTRKGLVVYKKVNNLWQYQKIHFLGIPVSIAYVDDRNQTWWACLDHGHWGVKLHRSFDRGENWEALNSPTYPEGAELKKGKAATTKYIWAFTHAGNDKPNELFLGTDPGGLFHSLDSGDHFILNQSLWEHESRMEHWHGGGRDNPGIHSIVIDPRNSDHLYIGISCAGVFESMDAGKTWMVRNKGLRADYLPDPYISVGHDPHLLVACDSNPDVLWQQNHCGIFRSIDGAKTWEDISDKNGIANFGFTIALDDEDENKAWVVPAISDEIRVSLNESLCVCRTSDGGKNWEVLRKGLPQEACFDIVYRHAMDVDKNWIVFGTTCGNLFISDNEGDSWTCLNSFLPMIYSVSFAYS